MPASDYGSATMIGFAVTFLVTGLGLIAAKGWLRQIGVLLVSLSGVWAVGLIGKSDGTHMSWFFAALAVYLASHGQFLIGRRLREKERRRYLTLTHGVRRFTNLTDNAFLACLADHLREPTAVTLALGRAGTPLLVDENPFVENLLKMRTVTRGSLLILTDERTATSESAPVAALRSHPLIELRPTHMTLPTLILDCSGEVFFTFGGNDPGIEAIWSASRDNPLTKGLASTLAEYVAAAAIDDPAGIRRLNVLSRSDSYHNAIVQVEAGATQVSKLVKRVSVVFKSPDFVEWIAEQRYGKHSEMYSTYVRSHIERRDQFHRKLREGTLQQREICSFSALMSHLRKPSHAGVGDIKGQYVREQVEELIATLRDYPTSFSLGLTDAPLPFRYSIFNGETVVLHEAVGTADIHRINSMFFADPGAVQTFEDEFEFLWSSIPRARKSNDSVAALLEKAISVGTPESV